MIVINTEIPRQVIEDVFVTALEGGSNYWYFLPEKSVNAIRKAVPKSVEPYLSINDAEDEDEELGVISMKTMPERLQKLSTESKWAFGNEIDGSGDASSSDVWLQYMAFGEIIFG